MPTYPSNKLCAEFNCKNPRSKLSSFCLNHGGKNTMPTRESDSIYQTAAWRSIRQRQLSIQPLCQACLGRGIVEQALHVDHVFAWKHIGRHAFLNNIFQSLCQPDHSHKTAMEKQGVYTHYTAEGEHAYTQHDYAYLMHQNNA
ncbi:HNHc domain containing protein [uncultured Caudovirales phage]|uniref:HNHc domain containing protein n=1 Tax=uncultured Caudovirales phage TaxID=2100421 RepID=A0A6J5MMC3_9CAUD|nr:HNHc domain containing protein [uncultured Caudovirales phage]